MSKSDYESARDKAANLYDNSGQGNGPIDDFKAGANWMLERANERERRYMDIESDNIQASKELKKLRTENARLKEALSYLPKIPSQPYEKELAQALVEAQNASASNAAKAIEAQVKLDIALQALNKYLWIDFDLSDPSGPASECLIKLAAMETK